MILQNIIWDEAEETTRELYYRGSNKEYLGEKIVIASGGILSTDTYMNLFDIETWRRYTLLHNSVLRLELLGKGKVVLRTMENSTCKMEVSFSCEVREEILISIPNEWCGKIFLEIIADSKVELYKACYQTEDTRLQKIKLAVVICTYKREQLLKQLLKKLEKVKNILSESMEVFVVDNASELNLADYSWIHLYHNRNTGGSGGFSRGMDEVVNYYDEFETTHVLLMDDDVVIQSESILRLYSFLSYMREEYDGDIVAGRMFRLDKPWVQYTAAEIWNGGDLRHIGFELDMNRRENLEKINDNSGAEYSGWWFCCIPYSFVKDNRPLPFFLHCDDVEYGLRHGGTPIILNGIHVWHETYEYRQSPVVAYYDMRNSLFVNAMYGQLKPKDELLIWWKEKITKAHVKKNYQLEFMLILAMWDFLKGVKWLKKVDVERNHVHRICTLKIKNKLITAVMWRITWNMGSRKLK